MILAPFPPPPFPCAPQMHRYGSGFTLIELSIVLLIIGLITGGILTGRDLIASSKVRAEVTQFEKIGQAVNAFRGKYDCLPGDCANASTFFPTLTAYACGAYIFQGCANGNGDGIITDPQNSLYPSQLLGEPLAFWENLFLAGLSDCCASTVSGTLQIGQKFPQDKINGYGISAVSINNQNGYFWGIINSTVHGGSYGGANADIYAALSGYPSAALGVLTPAQAKAFDAKIDDGIPVSGRVITAWLYGGDAKVHSYVYNGGQNCIASDSNYDLTQAGATCDLFLLMQ